MLFQRVHRFSRQTTALWSHISVANCGALKTRCGTDAVGRQAAPSASPGTVLGIFCGIAMSIGATLRVGILRQPGPGPSR